MFNRFEKPSYDELRNILSYLSYSDRDQWWKTFAIVGREYGNDSTAFDICQDWASRYSGRKAEDKRKEHTEFYTASKRNGPGIGALIKEAKLHGYQPPKVHKDSVHAHKAPESALDLFQVLSHTQPPATPQDDALEGLYGLAIGQARAALKFWMWDEAVAADKRAAFVRRYYKAIDMLPQEVNGYWRILREYVSSHSEFSYEAFVEWAGYTFKNFDPDKCLAYLAESERASCAEAACECMQRAADASWHISLIHRNQLLLDFLKKPQTKEDIERALSSFIYGSKMFNPQLPTLTGNDIAEVGRRVMSELLNPELCAMHFQPTHYKALDKYIYGWRRGEVSIMAAHSGVGKTWFGVDAANKVIAKGGRVLFITTEMSKDAIAHRFFSNVGRVSFHQLKDSMEQDRLLSDAARDNTEFFKDNDSVHIAYADKLSIVIDAIDTYSDFKAADLVVVDYLQNIFNDEADHKRTANWERVNATMNALTRAAERNHCPILVLAQLNNPNRKAGNNQEPNLYDIADASGVVRDAAAVMVMYKVTLPNSDGMSELRAKIVKSRYGNNPESHFTAIRNSGSCFNFVE